MRFNRLDLNLLVSLDALLAERNVTRAAARVAIGQPAMSSALGRLRAHFQDELLVQVGRRMTLTPLAESLSQPVRDVLLQMQAVTSARPSFEPATSRRRILMIVSDYVSAVFLTRLLPRVSALAPRMQFDFRTISLRYDEEFDAGDVDMMIMPNVLTVPVHPTERLWEDTFSCVVWQGNTEVGDTLTLERYMSLGHVGVTWGAGRLRSIDEDVMLARRQQRRFDVMVPFFSLAAPLVVGTNRIATVQTLLAQDMAKRWPLRVLPCPVPIPPIVESVSWHRYVDRDPAIVWFREQLHAAARDLHPQPPERQREPGRRTALPR